MKNLHFARFLQNDIAIISDMLRCVKLKLSHFAKYLQNDFIKKEPPQKRGGLVGCRGIEPLRRKMLKWYIDTEIALGSRISSGHPTYAFSHHCQYLLHTVYLLKASQ